MSTISDEDYTLSQLYNQISAGKGDPSQQELAVHLQTLSSHLSNPDHLQRESSDSENIQKLSLWVSKSILPDPNVISHDSLPEDPPTPSTLSAISLTQQKATHGLHILKIFQDLRPATPSSTLNAQILLSLLAFTSPRDPWTTPPLTKQANQLLSPHTTELHSHEFIITYLLQTFIRPLFSKSKPSERITTSGRKAMSSSAPPRKFDGGDLERGNRPWMYEVVYSVTVFEWAVENIPKELLSQTWNNFLPPLLTLLDSTSTPHRTRGLHLLGTFLPKLTPTLLKQTGLDSVFEDAVIPTLLYVPSITPLAESVQLLPAAYDALFVLSDVKFEGDDEEDMKERGRFLDGIMRKGVLTGYLHASEHPALVEILCIQIIKVVKKMGIHSVKHLKDISPIISSVLTDPFSPSRPELLLAAIKALQAVVLNAWPRISEPVHRMEVVKALVICWRNVTEEGVGDRDEEAMEDIRDELKLVGKLLVCAVESQGEVGFRSELQVLVEADERMGELFGIEVVRDEGR